MKTIKDLKIGEKVSLINTLEAIIIKSISIEQDLINNQYSQTDILELNINKDFVSFEMAKSMFEHGDILCFATGEYEDDEESEDYGIALYSEMGSDYGDTIEDLDQQTQYFTWNKLIIKTQSKMENVLNLSIEEQNSLIFESIIYQIVRDNKDKTAEEYIEDFDQYPEGFNNCFNYSYDEISTKAKQERRIDIIRYLAIEGCILLSEIND